MNEDEVNLATEFFYAIDIDDYRMIGSSYTAYKGYIRNMRVLGGMYDRDLEDRMDHAFRKYIG